MVNDLDSMNSDAGLKVTQVFDLWKTYSQLEVKVEEQTKYIKISDNKYVYTKLCFNFKNKALKQENVSSLMYVDDILI